jgi:hypothetical protein
MKNFTRIQEEILEDLQMRYFNYKDSPDTERMSALYYEATEFAQSINMLPSTFWRVFMHYDRRV